MSKIDLHIHSSFSLDGELSPQQLVKLGSEKGLRVMSITDHNSVRAVGPAVKAAESLGIKIIPGIEIDCIFRDLNLHILGYGINAEDSAFTKLEENALKQAADWFEKLISKLQEMDFIIDSEKVLNLSSEPVPSPEFVGEVLINSSENINDKRLDPYRSGGGRSDMPSFNFYRDFCAQGRPAYIEIFYPELEKIIAIIKSAGGIPVLAHPGASLSEPEKQLLPILETGVKGLEVFSSYHTPELARYYLEKADEYGMLITAGSDFHGKVKPAVELGGINCGEYENLILDKIVQYS